MLSFLSGIPESTVCCLDYDTPQPDKNPQMTQITIDVLFRAT